MSRGDKEPAGEPKLHQVQRWMQSVLMHRGGVAEGVDSPEAQAHIDISLSELPKVICPSQALSSADRLEIYVNAYHARLLECLDEEFVVTRWTMGDDLFSAVAFGYLQSYPSESYTLNQLGARFPRYLAESRLHAAGMPEGAVTNWPDFIIELATLERALYEVYDGPGTERQGPLDPSQLANLAPEEWGNLRLTPAPCLRLLEFRHAVSNFWGARKDDEEPTVEGPQPTWLAICRRDFYVERHHLSETQFRLLERLAGGAPLAQAIASASELSGVDIESALGEWFAQWMVAGFFGGYQTADSD